MNSQAMSKNTGDGELEEILFMAFVGLWMRDADGNFVSLDDKYGVLKDRLKVEIKEYATQEANKAVKRYQELQHEELTNELIKTEREAQQKLLQELMEHCREYEITDLEMLDHHNETPLVAVPISVIQNKLEGLS